MENAVEIRNLTKAYEKFTLDDLNLTLPSGCIMGLIGENGAGKSTTFKLILDMISRDGGEIKLLGKDNRTGLNLLKENIGIVPDEIGLPPTLNAKQVGKIMANSSQTGTAKPIKAIFQSSASPTTRHLRSFRGE